MSLTTHTSEQGLRLHYLASLDGLLAVAALDYHPSDFLLGILLDIAARVPGLPEQRQEELRARGEARIKARAAEKRAWNIWRRAQHLQRLDLTTVEIRRLLEAVAGSEAPRATCCHAFSGPSESRPMADRREEISFQARLTRAHRPRRVTPMRRRPRTLRRRGPPSARGRGVLLLPGRRLQRSAVKASYARNLRGSSWAAPGTCLAREGAQRDGAKGRGFDAEHDNVNLTDTLGQWHVAWASAPS